MTHQLPVEVVRSIVDSVDPSEVKTFSNISLASRRLRAIGQPYLFRECRFELVTPTMTRDYVWGEVGEMIPSRASTLLGLTPDLIHHIRTIKIVVEEKRMENLQVLSQPNGPPTSYTMINSGLALSQIILNAANLKEISFPYDVNGLCFNWKLLPVDLQAAIVATAPRVTTMDTTAIEYRSFPVESFAQFKQLKHLTLDFAVHLTDGPDESRELKHISLDTLNMGQSKAFSDWNQQQPWYHLIDTTQLKRLRVYGILNQIDHLLSSKKLMRLEWDMKHRREFETMAPVGHVGVPGSNTWPYIPIVNLNNLQTLQELHIHAHLVVTRTHIRTTIPYITALLQTAPQNNRISAFTLELTVSKIESVGHRDWTIKGVDLDDLVSTFLTPTLARLRNPIFTFRGHITGIGVQQAPNPGCSIVSAMIDDILSLNPVLRGLVEDGRVEVVAVE